MKKVVIIGAGPAGLTAANELLKLKKYEVIILEETNSIGGIAKTVNYKGNRMDIGGHRFFSKDENIKKYWQDLLPMQGYPSYDDKKLQIKKKLKDGGPDPEQENKVMLIRNRISRIFYLRKFFDYPISMKIDTFKNMGIVKTFKVGMSYLKSCIFKRKEESLEDFYINRFGKVLYEMFFKDYTQKLWGRSPKDISPDWGEQRVKGISIYEILKNIFVKKDEKQVETSLIQEFWYPKLGPGELWEVLAENIEKQGGKIFKNHKVQNINIENKKIKSVTCKVDGQLKDFEGDIFISSMPIKDLIEGIENENGVPNEILEIAKGLPYRDFITIGLLVKKLKIKNNTNIKTIRKYCSRYLDIYTRIRY